MDVEKIIHIGIYAIILSEDKNEILLIKKSRGPYIGMLDLPGGSPEFEEELEDTLIRELKEETGLQVKNFAQIKTLVKIIRNDNKWFRHIGVIYFVETSGVVNTDSDGQDSNGCLWLNISEISDANCTPFVNMIAPELR